MSLKRKNRIWAWILAATLLPFPAMADVPASRLEAAASQPNDWLTYSGDYSGQRYSTLSQITPENIGKLHFKWMLQSPNAGVWEANPLVVDGIMYVSQRPNDIVALDAATGRVFWVYHYTPEPLSKVCCGANNRGLAILGNTLYMGTLDANLIAVDRRTGKALWKTKVAETKDGYSITGAPLAVKDKVLIGVSGGERGIRGFVAAFDAKTGAEAWRFNTIPAPGEPGSETWKGDDWKHGGGPTWLTGSYDPDLNLVYWGVGNPGPDWNPGQRPGDNLYSNSVVALDADTGKLKWHFQFTPNGGYDYDAVQMPVLVDREWDGKQRKLMLWANRNGFFYVLDRRTGEYLLGEPFIPVNWASGLDKNGRPIQTPQPSGVATYPGVNGGTNWYPPSYSPKTGLIYVPIWENYGAIYRREEVKFSPGESYVGGGFSVVAPNEYAATPHMGKIGPAVNDATVESGNGAIIAIDPRTGKRAWTHKMTAVTDAGMLSTSTHLVFSGGREGYFYALDDRTGKTIWKVNVGSIVAMAPITYAVDGRQYVSVISGTSLLTFGLDD